MFHVSKRFNGRTKRIKIGAWPILSLPDARDEARRILLDIELGQYDEKALDDKLKVPTVGEVVPQFIELYSRPRNKDWKGTENMLSKFSRLDTCSIDRIKRVDIVSVLDMVVAGGAPTRANRALEYPF